MDVTVQGMKRHMILTHSQRRRQEDRNVLSATIQDVLRKSMCSANQFLYKIQKDTNDMNSALNDKTKKNTASTVSSMIFKVMFVSIFLFCQFYRITFSFSSPAQELVSSNDFQLHLQQKKERNTCFSFIFMHQITVNLHFIEAMGQCIRAFAPQVEGQMFEFQPRQT